MTLLIALLLLEHMGMLSFGNVVLVILLWAVHVANT